MRGVASAPSKAILVGEHFVVENQPAIAVALNLRARAEVTESSSSETIIISENLKLEESFSKDNVNEKSPLYPIYYAKKLTLEHLNLDDYGLKIRISSEIPPASGMGSSAAVSVATIAAILKFFDESLDKEKISKLAYEAEKIVHGKPSGIDNTISTYGGAIIFRKSEGFISLKSNFERIKIILADSGLPRSTGEMVRQVLSLKKKYEKIMEPIYHGAGRLAIEVAKAIENNDFETVGELMNINHGLLSAINVSNKKLEELVYTARENGALGAKITGAGGGGFIIALSYEDRCKMIVEELRKLSPRVIVCDVSKDGVTIEDN
ncbi:MAG: mevalonate kinase [Thermoprotei archaeon]|nr:MAG: mevalonate kinase [Thermoprotei archaeon]